MQLSVLNLPTKARWYSRVFKLSLALMMLDFFLCIIWLPIGASRAYGLRSTQDAFMQTCECLLRAKVEAKMLISMQIMELERHPRGTISCLCGSNTSPLTLDVL